MTRYLLVLIVSLCAARTALAASKCHQCGQTPQTEEACAKTPFSPPDPLVVGSEDCLDDMPCMTIRTEDVDAETFKVERRCAVPADSPVAFTRYSYIEESPNVFKRVSTTFCSDDDCNSENSVVISGTCHVCQGADDTPCGEAPFDITDPAVAPRKCAGLCVLRRTEPEAGPGLIERGCADDGETTVKCTSKMDGVSGTKTDECFYQGLDSNGGDREEVRSSCFTCDSSDQANCLVADDLSSYSKQCSDSEVPVPCVIIRTEDNDGTNPQVVRKCADNQQKTNDDIHSVLDGKRVQTSYCNTFDCNVKAEPIPFTCFECGAGNGQIECNVIDFPTGSPAVCATEMCVTTTTETATNGINEAKTVRGCAESGQEVGTVYAKTASNVKKAITHCADPNCNTEATAEIGFTCHAYACGSETPGEPACVNGDFDFTTTPLARCEVSDDRCVTIRTESVDQATFTEVRRCAPTSEAPTEDPQTVYAYTGDITVPASLKRVSKSYCGEEDCNNQKREVITETCHECEDDQVCAVIPFDKTAVAPKSCGPDHFCSHARYEIGSDPENFFVKRGCELKAGKRVGCASRIETDADSNGIKIDECLCDGVDCNDGDRDQVHSSCITCNSETGDQKACISGTEAVNDFAGQCEAAGFPCVTVRTEDNDGENPIVQRMCAAKKDTTSGSFHTTLNNKKIFTSYCNEFDCNKQLSTAIPFTCLACGGAGGQDECAVAVDPDVAHPTMVCGEGVTMCLTSRTETLNAEGTAVKIVRGCAAAGKTEIGTFYFKKESNIKEVESYCQGSNCNTQTSAAIGFTCHACGGSGQPLCKPDAEFDFKATPVIPCTTVAAKCLTMRTEIVAAPATYDEVRQCISAADAPPSGTGTFYNYIEDGIRRVSSTFCDSDTCNNQNPTAIEGTCHVCEGGDGEPCANSPFLVTAVPPQACAAGDLCLLRRTEIDGEFTIERQCATGAKEGCRSVQEINSGLDTKIDECYCKGTDCNNEARDDVRSSCIKCDSESDSDSSCTDGADAVNEYAGQCLESGLACVTIRTEEGPEPTKTRVQRECAARDALASDVLFESPTATKRIMKSYCDTFDCNTEVSAKIPFTCFQCDDADCLTFDITKVKTVGCPTNVCSTTRSEVTTAGNTVSTVTRGCAASGIDGKTVYFKSAADTRQSVTYCSSKENCNTAETESIPFTCHGCGEPDQPACEEGISYTEPEPLSLCPDNVDKCLTARVEKTSSPTHSIIRGCETKNRNVNGETIYSTPVDGKVAEIICAGADCNTQTTDVIPFTCYTCDMGELCNADPYNNALANPKACTTGKVCMTTRTETYPVEGNGKPTVTISRKCARQAGPDSKTKGCSNRETLPAGGVGKIWEADCFCDTTNCNGEKAGSYGVQACVSCGLIGEGTTACDDPPFTSDMCRTDVPCITARTTTIANNQYAVKRKCAEDDRFTNGTHYTFPTAEKQVATQYCTGVDCNKEKTNLEIPFTCYTCGGDGFQACSLTEVVAPLTGVAEACPSLACITLRTELLAGGLEKIERRCATAEESTSADPLTYSYVGITEADRKRLSKSTCKVQNCNKEIPAAIPVDTCHECVGSGEHACAKTLFDITAVAVVKCAAPGTKCLTRRSQVEGAPSAEVTRGCAPTSSPPPETKCASRYDTVTKTKIDECFCEGRDCNKDDRPVLRSSCLTCTNAATCLQAENLLPFQCKDDLPCVTVRTEDGTLSPKVERYCARANSQRTGDVHTVTGNKRVMESYCDAFDCNKEVSSVIPFTCIRCSGASDSACDKLNTNVETYAAACESKVCATARTEGTFDSVTIYNVIRECGPARKGTGIFYSKPGLTTKQATTYCDDATNCNTVHSTAIGFSCHACGGGANEPACTLDIFNPLTTPIKPCGGAINKCLTTRIEREAYTSVKRSCEVDNRLDGNIIYSTPDPAGQTVSEMVCIGDDCNTGNTLKIPFLCYKCSGPDCEEPFTNAVGKPEPCPLGITTCSTKRIEAFAFGSNTNPAVSWTRQCAASNTKQTGCSNEKTPPTNAVGKIWTAECFCGGVKTPHCNGAGTGAAAVRACLTCSSEEGAAEDCNDDANGLNEMCDEDFPCVTSKITTTATNKYAIERGCAPNKKLQSGDFYTTPNGQTVASRYCNDAGCNTGESPATVPFSCYTCGQSGLDACALTNPLVTTTAVALACPDNVKTCVTTRKEPPNAGAATITRGCALSDAVQSLCQSQLTISEGKKESCYCATRFCNIQAIAAVRPSCYKCDSTNDPACVNSVAFHLGAAGVQKLSCAEDVPCVTVKTIRNGQQTVVRGCGVTNDRPDGEVFSTPDPNTWVSRRTCRGFDCNHHESADLAFSCYSCGNGAGEEACTTGATFDIANTELKRCSTFRCFTTRTETTTVQGLQTVVKRGCSPDDGPRAGPPSYSTPTADTKVTSTVCSGRHCNKLPTVAYPFTCYTCEGSGDQDDCAKAVFPFATATPTVCGSNVCMTSRTERGAVTTIKRGCGPAGKTGSEASSDGAAKTLAVYCGESNCNKAAVNTVNHFCYTCAETDAGKAACMASSFNPRAVGVTSQNCGGTDFSCLTTRTEVAGSLASVTRQCVAKSNSAVTFETPNNATKISKEVCNELHCNGQNSAHVPFTCYDCKGTEAKCNADVFLIADTAVAPKVCATGVCVTTRTEKDTTVTVDRSCAENANKQFGCDYPTVAGAKQSKCFCHTPNCNGVKTSTESGNAASASEVAVSVFVASLCFALLL